MYQLQETKAAPLAVNEMAASAQMEAARAKIEAAFIVAMRRPRSIEMARQRITTTCKNPLFAKDALYQKPVGNKQFVVGPSIRMAEMALMSWGNIRCSSTVIYEDDLKRKVCIEVLDLETNAGYEKEITISKTREKKKGNLKDWDEIISKRKNSQDEETYLVRCTEGEMQMKVSAEESKVIRNSVLRLIPQDIIAEAQAICEDTNRNAIANNRSTQIRAIVDAFAEQGIEVKDLEGYLKHSMSGVSAVELDALRRIYQTIKEGEASWRDYIDNMDVDDSRPKNQENAKKQRAGRPAKKQQETAPPKQEAPKQEAEEDDDFAHEVEIDLEDMVAEQNVDQGKPEPAAEKPAEEKPAEEKKEENPAPKKTRKKRAKKASKKSEEAPEETTTERGFKHRDDPRWQDMIRTWDGDALKNAYKKYTGEEPVALPTGAVADAIIDGMNQKRLEKEAYEKRMEKKPTREEWDAMTLVEKLERANYKLDKATKPDIEKRVKIVASMLNEDMLKEALNQSMLTEEDLETAGPGMLKEFLKEALAAAKEAE